MKYGRDDGDWEQLIAAGRRFLEEQAKLQKTTTYTEMNAVLERRTHLQAFDFDRDDGRAAMGYLLGLIVNDSFPETDVMLSALVQYLNENDAGPGFFQLAKDLGLLRSGANEEEKLAFWSGQVAAVHARTTTSDAGNPAESRPRRWHQDDSRNHIPASPTDRTASLVLAPP